MKKPYYLFSNGRLCRRDNTLCLIRHVGDRTPDDAPDATGEPSPGLVEERRVSIPIEQVSSLYLFGEVDVNARLVTLLGRKHIPLHFFDYYGNYTATLYPRRAHLDGALRLAQARAVLNAEHRLALARAVVEASGHNMRCVVRYYARRHDDPDRADALRGIAADLRTLLGGLDAAPDVPALMGLEGALRDRYYEAWPHILHEADPCFHLAGRTRRPPGDAINALISFGNALCYAAVERHLHRTPLDVTLSFLHAPGARRPSLALDLADVFKPLLVDRLIFRLVNRGRLTPGRFVPRNGGTYLDDEGRRVVVATWDERLHQTRHERNLGRSLSRDGLLRHTCHDLLRHLRAPDEAAFSPYRATW